ncbi:hypothetical protein OC834_006228, partial [Tilletia horrida]
MSGSNPCAAARQLDSSSSDNGKAPKCVDVTGLYVMGDEDLAFVMLGMATISMLFPLTVSLVLFSTPALRSNVIFALTLAATLCTIVFFALSLTSWLRTSYQLDLSAPLVRRNSQEIVRRLFQQFLPWLWDFVLFLKLTAFYPRSIYTAAWHRWAILSVPLIAKFRLPLDIASFAITVQLIVVPISNKLRFGARQQLERRFYFASILMRLLDNIATASLLIYKSISFYRRRSVALGPSARRVRLLVESLFMSFVGIVPIQIALAVYYGRLVIQNDTSARDKADLLILVDLALESVFGIFGTVWSSIGATTLMPTHSYSSGSKDSQSRVGRGRRYEGWFLKRSPPATKRSDKGSNEGKHGQQDEQAEKAVPVGRPPRTPMTNSATETLLSIFFVAEDAGR